MTEFSGDLGGGNPDRPRFAAIGLPDAGEPVWTPDRIGRHELLITKSKGVNGLLGRLYGTAVNLLPQLDVPGSMTLLAHCVREVYNRYPNFDGFTVPKMQGSRNAAVKSLVEMWVAVEDRHRGGTGTPSLLRKRHDLGRDRGQLGAERGGGQSLLQVLPELHARRADAPPLRARRGRAAVRPLRAAARQPSRGVPQRERRGGRAPCRGEHATSDERG